MRHWALLLVPFLLGNDAQAEVLTFRSEVVPTSLTATIGGDLAFPNGSGPFPHWARNTSGSRPRFSECRICHLHFGQLRPPKFK
jgi:hypothetical protein